MNIGLIGNPNCGKTTLFNELTGTVQYVGNWPGVTVEKKSGIIKKHSDINIVDLPGIYSLSPYTLEEIITRDYIVKEKPDVIINIVDASNLERNLYLTTQILELNVPVIIALNMMDIIEKNGDLLDTKALALELGCEIVEISALKNKGLDRLIEKVKMCYENRDKFETKKLDLFSNEIENKIYEIENIIVNLVSETDKRWIAIKLFENDKKVLGEIQLDDDKLKQILDISSIISKKLDDDTEAIIINERYVYIEKIVNKIIKHNTENKLITSEKIDSILTNKYLGIPIFVGVMFLIYYIAIQGLGLVMTDWTNDVLFGTYIVDFANNLLAGANVSPWLNGLVIDGIIGGVGAVLGFLPQIVLLFTFLCILEECGYMARVAFMLDRIFRKIGLSGKSFIPLLISSGCGVPAIMASRTIENEKDRKITIMITTFIPCSAKIPIIALFGAALFPNNIFMGPSIYFVSMIMIVISGLILKKFRAFKGNDSPFIMELPKYHMPSPKNVTLHIYDRVKAFVIKAGTIIFASSIIIWLLSSFDFRFDFVVDKSNSILATLGKIIAPIFVPLGFGTWQATVATLNGLVAKEVLVTTYGVLLGIADADSNMGQLSDKIREIFTTTGAYSFVVFNMLCAPCFAAIGAIKREMVTWKWTLITVGYQTGLAYITALIIYQLGNMFYGQFNILGISASLFFIASMIYLIVRKSKV